MAAFLAAFWAAARASGKATLMRTPWSSRGSSVKFRQKPLPAGWRRWRLFLIPAIGLAVVFQLAASSSASTIPAAAANAKTATAGAVKPKQANELDCNGWSHKYRTVRQLAGDLCTDPIKVTNGKGSRFIDNGWYVGHDEPSTKFISSQPGSGNTMTYVMKLPKDPAKVPTSSGSVVDYAQLSIAPWFGLPICDPKSYPQNPCTPDSDSNSGQGDDPNGAGSAFMELQFYPPGFTPFVDSVSCNATKWCAALTIDSLECTFGFATCNNNCEEPVNFAYIQTNSVPAGPPSPQLTDMSTFTPNSHTLMINPGDVVVVTISDPPAGFTTKVADLTTHKTGWMTASAANGFMNTNIADCSGTPFTFHAEYSSAKQQNQVPWAALEGGVLMQQEIGHSEVCRSLANQDPYSAGFPDGQSFSDPNVYDTCMGGSEGPGATGEGSCDLFFVCQNPTTQGPSGPVACPTDSAASGQLCEFADGNCFQRGARTVVINGVPATESARANECLDNRFQNGDLDFDGLSYRKDWPNGSKNFPTTFQYVGPFTLGGHTYPTVQFESNVGGSSNLCDVNTGSGCTVPPISAKFYPFWSLARATRHGHHAAPLGGHAKGCVWNFGNDQPNTVADFGKDAQYGTPNLARFGGTIISAPMPNPEFTGHCKTW